MLGCCVQETSEDTPHSLVTASWIVLTLNGNKGVNGSLQVDEQTET